MCVYVRPSGVVVVVVIVVGVGGVDQDDDEAENSKKRRKQWRNSEFYKNKYSNLVGFAVSMQ